MSKKKQSHGQEDSVEQIQGALSKTEQFIEDNQKKISIVVGALIAVVLLYMAVNKYYLKPIEEEASREMMMAEMYFQKDSFNLALNGDGSSFGFLDIIDEYGVSSSANLAKYYAGISYLHLGNYEEAIDYLSDFKTDDPMLNPVSKGAIGDSYVQQGELEKGAEFYMKAANASDNDFTSPVYLMKAGEIYESLGEYDKALNAYTKIDKEYPESTEARQVQKYITRTKLSME